MNQLQSFSLCACVCFLQDSGCNKRGSLVILASARQGVLIESFPRTFLFEGGVAPQRKSASMLENSHCHQNLMLILLSIFKYMFLLAF